MTPLEVNEYARNQYNAVGDTFFSDLEIYKYIYDAEMQLAKETNCIRSVTTMSSVDGQQEYTFPANVIMVKRLTYDGLKVEPRSLEEVLDLTNSVASPTGTPYIYAIWNETLYLGPIPSDVKTIKFFAIKQPTVPTATSTLEVPERYHADLAQYACWMMCVKDKNYTGAATYGANWAQVVQRAKAFERKMYRGQGFSFVKDADRDVDSWNLLR